MDLDFCITPPQPCSYLPDRQSTLLFADPRAALSSSIYNRLIERGFRRSGDQIYRPGCSQCNACIPLRIPVAKFAPRRNQRRIWLRNSDLEVAPLPPGYDDEHYQLYRRYLHDRHRGSEMDNLTPQNYLAFLSSSWSDTVFYQFRLRQKLLAVAVADRLDRGFSAVYSFFDPAYTTRSLGNYAILWLIREANRHHLPWLYLGYWIKECRNMAYKSRYRPCEIYRDGRWQPHGKNP